MTSAPWRPVLLISRWNPLQKHDDYCGYLASLTEGQAAIRKFFQCGTESRSRVYWIPEVASLGDLLLVLPILIGTFFFGDPQEHFARTPENISEFSGNTLRELS